MKRRIRRGVLSPVLAAAVAGTLALSGCGTTGALEAEAARDLQASVREIADLTAAGNTQAAVDRAEALRQEVESAAAAGTVSGERAALIEARIDAVIAAIREEGEEPDPSESATPPAPVPTSAAPPAPVVPAPVEPAPVEPTPAEVEPETEAPEPEEPAPQEPEPEEPKPEDPKDAEDQGKGNKDDDPGKGNDDSGKGKPEEPKEDD
ncbi:hypothetical protein ACX80W_08460 [Arthrobacter sp. TMN-37]